MKRIVSILAAIHLILFSLYLFSQEQEKARMDYRIGPKDLLDIRVFGLDELNTTVRVSEEGKITLPLLGEVVAEGFTQGELEKKLTSLLEEKYLKNPQLTVFIQEYQSKRVSVIGAVKNPGPYELLGAQTLMQVISDAGGLTPEAGEEIIVVRQFDDGDSVSFRVSVDELYYKGNAKLNIPIRPNDIVNVPIDKVIQIYVYGQVRNPGALEVRRSNIPTLLQAIAQAGGFSERASKRRVLIKRRDKSGGEVEIKVNVKSIISGKSRDIKLQENDVVIVPETIF